MIRKILVYCILIACSIGVILIFLTSTTYVQLAIASALYLPIVYYAFKALPRKARNTIVQNQEPVTVLKPLAPEIKTETSEIADVDKRAFLKLIGATSFAVFLYSIFSKKPGATFFSTASAPTIASLQDTTGRKINPAEEQPTDGYKITEVDDSVVTFFGFTNKEGAWFVMREDTDTGSFRYAKGSSNFSDNWTNRENLKFDYYHNIF